MIYIKNKHILPVKTGADRVLLSFLVFEEFAGTLTVS